MIACIDTPLPDDHRVPLSCEATLRLFLDHAPAAVAMFDRNMRYLYVSRRWLADYGLTGQEIIGRSHYEIFPEIPEHWKAVHQRCLAGATEQCEEEQFRRLDGETVWLRWEVFPWHDAAGTIGGIIITTETTTERTRMTGALRESEEHYRSLFNGMTEGFALHEIVCDEAGAPCDYRILEINPAFEQLTGLSREQTVGKLLSNVLPDEDPRWVARFGAVALTGEPVRFEDHSTALDRDYEVYAYRPAARQFAVIFRETTEQRRSQRELVRLNQELRRKVEELETLFRTVPIGISITNDPEGRHIRGNPAIEQLLGVPPGGELSVVSSPDRPPAGYRVLYEGREMAPEDLPMQRAVRGETVTGQMVEIVREDGNIVNLYCNAAPLYDDQGQPHGAVGAFLDITELKRAEEALRTSEERNRLLVETMRQGVVHQDVNGTIISMNPAAERILGKNREEFLGSSSVKEEHHTLYENGDPFPGSEHPSMVALYTGRPVRDVIMGVFNPKLSEYRWLRVDGVPLYRSGETRPFEVYSVFEDITERKRTDDDLRKSALALQASEQRMQQALHVSRSFTFEWQPATDRVLRSASCGTILNLMGDEAVNDTGEHFFQRVHPDDRESFVQTLRDLKPEADTYTAEYRVVREDGSIAVLEETGRASFDAAGTLQQLVGVSTDITARKQAETALRDSERLYRAIGESIQYGVWVCTPEGRNIYASDSFLKLVGLTQEQCSDFGWGDVLHPDDAERTISAWQECVRTGGNWDIEHRFRGVDGQWHPILARGVPVRNEDGAVIYWAGINLDISRIKRVEAELQRAHDELEMRVRERTVELAATIDTLRREMSEREQAEASVQRLNRLYAVLSETDQTIVRANDRDSLFRDICQIAVVHGGFLLSWVGLVDELSGQVQIVAAQGATTYLDDIRISVNADEPAGAGPTGISLRSGTYYICNDFQHDPCTRPWHEQGKIHGIQASASIALKEEGRVLGTLTLYAGERDFFDEQHQSLLRQMGADISFALDNLAREVRRREAEKALLQATAERLQALEELREKDHLLVQQSRQAAMGEMIGNIAHQWRQPLNTLGLAIQDLALSCELGELSPELLQTRVDKAMQVISHMSRTIDDFRNFFRPDKQKEPFKVSRVIGNALSLIGSSYKNLQIRVEVDTGI